MQPAQLRIERVDPQCSEALDLLHEAAVEARHLYPEYLAADAPLPTNAPTPPRGVYLLARLRDQAVGMGAHRPVDALTTEIRRMFVTRHARRLGVARAVLAALEQHALSVGFQRIILETGFRQLAAMQLYAKHGFMPTEPFGPYVDDPTSRCYVKHLGLSREA